MLRQGSDEELIGGRFIQIREIVIPDGRVSVKPGEKDHNADGVLDGSPIGMPPIGGNERIDIFAEALASIQCEQGDGHA